MDTCTRKEKITSTGKSKGSRRGESFKTTSKQQGCSIGFS